MAAEALFASVVHVSTKASLSKPFGEYTRNCVCRL